MDRSSQALIAAAAVVYGVLSGVCWLLSWRYASELGGVWTVGAAIASSAVLGAVGAAIGPHGERARPALRVHAGLLLGLGVLFSATGLRPSPMPGAMLVSGAALLLAGWGPAARVRTWLGAAGLFGCTALVGLHTWRLHGQPPLHGPPVALELIRVDDDADPFRALSDLPAGGEVAEEAVSGVERSYLRVAAGEGETLAALRRRAGLWVQQHVRLPAGRRVAWEPDPEHRGTAIRSHVLREPAFVTSRDVADARLSNDGDAARPVLAVSLRPEAAERVREVTRAHVGRRLAILLDGSVQAVPTVVSEITGEHLLIVLAEGTAPEEARGLAAGLRGELLHGP